MKNGKEQNELQTCGGYLIGEENNGFLKKYGKKIDLRLTVSIIDGLKYDLDFLISLC